jgi:hypothetical protein
MGVQKSIALMTVCDAVEAKHLLMGVGVTVYKCELTML